VETRKAEKHSAAYFDGRGTSPARKNGWNLK